MASPPLSGDTILNSIFKQTQNYPQCKIHVEGIYIDQLRDLPQKKQFEDSTDLCIYLVLTKLSDNDKRLNVEPHWFILIFDSFQKSFTFDSYGRPIGEICANFSFPLPNWLNSNEEISPRLESLKGSACGYYVIYVSSLIIKHYGENSCDLSRAIYFTKQNINTFFIATSREVENSVIESNCLRNDNKVSSLIGSYLING
jgi:hypothetical protein